MKQFCNNFAETMKRILNKNEKGRDYALPRSMIAPLRAG